VAVITIVWIALGVAAWALSTRKRPDPMAGRLVPRTSFTPLPMQRAAIDETLRRERDLTDAYESARYRYSLEKLKLKFDTENPK
jgi:hypothetical protein